MKNLTGLIIFIAILVSCTNPAAQRKQEINQRIEKLRADIEQLQLEKNRLKEEFAKVAVRYGAMPTENLSEANRIRRQVEFEDDIDVLENRLQITEKKYQLDKLEIERLKIELAQL